MKLVTLAIVILLEALCIQGRKIERFRPGAGCGSSSPIITLNTRPTGVLANPCVSLEYFESKPDMEELVKVALQGKQISRG